MVITESFAIIFVLFILSCISFIKITSRLILPNAALSRRDEPLALAPWGEEAVGSNGLVNAAFGGIPGQRAEGATPR